MRQPTGNSLDHNRNLCRILLFGTCIIVAWASDQVVRALRISVLSNRHSPTYAMVYGANLYLYLS